jgi:hypothetical protein
MVEAMDADHNQQAAALPRVLAVWCGGGAGAAANGAAANDAESDLPPFERPDDPSAAVRQLARGEQQLRVLVDPTAEELRAAAQDLNPTHAYFVGAFRGRAAANPAHGALGALSLRGVDGSSSKAIAETLDACCPDLRCVYLDVAPSSMAEELHAQRRRRRAQGAVSALPPVAAVVAWPCDPPAAVASQFAQAFFAHLAAAAVLASVEAPLASPESEAYGCALLATAGVVGSGRGPAAAAAAAALPRLPELLLLSAASDECLSDQSLCALPDARTVPRGQLAPLPPGIATPADVPAWQRSALLAPRCELRLRVVAGSGPGAAAAAMAAAAAAADGSNADGGLLDPVAVRLSYVGEGLRALLAAEVRSLELVVPTTVATAKQEEEQQQQPPPPAPPLLLEPLDPSPCPLPSSCRAVRAHVQARGGARFPVVMVLPDAVIDAANAQPSRPALARLAMRHALLADALALQVLLPPSPASAAAVAAMTTVGGVPLPVPPPPRPRAHPAIAGGLPGVDCLAHTSVWAAVLLRCLAAASGGGGGEGDSAVVGGGARELALLGVTAVGCTPTRAFSPTDVERLYPLAVPPPPSPLVARPTARDVLAASAGAFGGGKASAGVATAAWALAGAAGVPAGSVATARADPPTPNPLAVPGAAGGERAALSSSSRLPLDECSDQALAAEILAFLRASSAAPSPQAAALVAATLAAAAATGPTAPLVAPLAPGVAVDLAALYRAVVARGGFRAASAINWRGQVLPRCVCGGGGGATATSAAHRLAAPGHALRRLYAALLWPYERAHASDASQPVRCPLCARGDEDEVGLPAAEDWLACDGCDAWVHHSCDARARPGKLRPFSAYEGGEGEAYYCGVCAAAGGGGGKEEGEGGGAGA